MTRKSTGHVRPTAINAVCRKYRKYRTVAWYMYCTRPLEQRVAYLRRVGPTNTFVSHAHYSKLTCNLWHCVCFSVSVVKKAKLLSQSPGLSTYFHFFSIPLNHTIIFNPLLFAFVYVWWISYTLHTGWTRSQAVARIADRTVKNCRGHVT